MLNAQSFLEKRYKPTDELEDCVNMAILTLKEAFEGEMDEKNVEIGIVDETTKKFRVLTPNEVKDYIAEINQ